MSHHTLSLIRRDIDAEGRVEFTFDNNLAIQFPSEDAVIEFVNAFDTPVELMSSTAIVYSQDHGGLGQCIVTFDLLESNGNVLKVTG